MTTILIAKTFQDWLYAEAVHNRKIRDIKKIALKVVIEGRYNMPEPGTTPKEGEG